MANEQNLRPPFQPGEKVPGAGRPKGSKNLRTIIRELLEHPYPGQKNPLTGEPTLTGTQAIVVAQVLRAVGKKDLASAAWLMDRGYGKEANLIGEDPENPMSNSLAAMLAAADGKTAGLPVVNIPDDEPVKLETPTE